MAQIVKNNLQNGLAGSLIQGQTAGRPYSTNQMGYMPGLVEMGNIDLNGRPKVPIGENYGTIGSATEILPDGRVVNIPTIYDGKVNEGDAAYRRAIATGKNLGEFDNIQNAVNTAKNMSYRQGLAYGVR